jgi:hypothetical protein
VSGVRSSSRRTILRRRGVTRNPHVNGPVKLGSLADQRDRRIAALDRAVSNLHRAVVRGEAITPNSIWMLALAARQAEYHGVMRAIERAEYSQLRFSQETREAHWAVLHRTGLPPTNGKVPQPAGGKRSYGD